jgi:hypothetical protein
LCLNRRVNRLVNALSMKIGSCDFNGTLVSCVRFNSFENANRVHDK